MILLFLMYRLLCSLFFRNYVILCLFSGGGGGASFLSFYGLEGPLLLSGFLRIASLCVVIPLS